MSLPPFDVPVTRNGYAWWYLDAFSEDGRHGLTLIAFVGSVFSPYYAWARARGEGEPENFCSVNLAIYGPGARWAMTERSDAMNRTAEALTIGPSQLSWNGSSLDISIDEWTVPIPRRLKGKIRVHPTSFPGQTFELDAAGRHRWTPVSPRVRVEVELEHPALRWQGHGYLDHNAGDEPLEDGFSDWQWSRADLGEDAVILYDANRRDGSERSVALRFDAAGNLAPIDPPPWTTLPTTGWRVKRSTRAEDGEARVQSTWEDTPFYARSKLEARLLGRPATAVHESLSLDRFSSRWVQILLPFRMPRR